MFYYLGRSVNDLPVWKKICERGNHLRDFASSQQQLQQLNSDLAGMGDAQLLKENRELKRLLHKTEDEKKALKDQIRAYESQLHRLQVRRFQENIVPHLLISEEQIFTWVN